MHLLLAESVDDALTLGIDRGFCLRHPIPRVEAGEENREARAVEIELGNNLGPNRLRFGAEVVRRWWFSEFLQGKWSFQVLDEGRAVSGEAVLGIQADLLPVETRELVRDVSSVVSGLAVSTD